MNAYYVLIKEENRNEFDSVVPDYMELNNNRVAVAAVDDDLQILGAISYVIINFQVEIDWIYVDPKVRRKGVGKGLINEVLRALMKTGELLPVVASYEYDEDDEELHMFFLYCDNMMTSYSHERFYLKPKDIKNCALLHSAEKSGRNFDHFFDLEKESQIRVLNSLHRQQYYVSNYENWKKNCVPDLCRCTFKDNELTDLILMCNRPDGNIELSYLYAKNPKDLFNIISETAMSLEKDYPDCGLVFDTINMESEKIAKHLFPESKTVHIYAAEF